MVRATMFFRIFPAVLIAFCILSISAPAFADDWEAIKLRGKVFAFNGTGWDELQRGAVVSDERVIRTLRSGRVSFRRAQETIEIGGATQISIHDRSGQRYTVVEQYYGDVRVEAEHKNVQHFAVQTPYLAAVVKGTRFRVRSDDTGAEVEVTRGQVEVRDTIHDAKVRVNPGQHATASNNAPLEVEGSGPLDQVVTFDGEPFAMATAPASDDGIAEAADGDDVMAGSAGTSAGSKGIGKAVSQTASDAVTGAGTTVKSTVKATTKTTAATVKAVSSSTKTVTHTVAKTVSSTVSTVAGTTKTVTKSVGGLVGGLLGH